MVLHGYLRTTLDLDLVIELEKGNLSRAVEVFSRLGLQPRLPVALNELTESEKRAEWIREKHMTVFSLWHPDDPTLAVDLFVDEPFDFEETYRRALSVRLPETPAKVIGLEDLIRMKEAAGRPVDLQDLEALSRLAAGKRKEAEEP